MTTSLMGPAAYAQSASAYLRHYRALGVRYRGVEHTLSKLGRYLVAAGAPDLNGPQYESWCLSRAALHSNSRRKAEQIVHKFCLYRRRTEPAAFVPSPESFSRLRPYVRPVIVEPEQIVAMLAAANTLPPGNRSPLRAAIARVATVLLYTSGLRSGEVRRLRVEDIEDGGSVLRIRESKFHKSRFVPLSPSTQMEVHAYLKQRAIFAVKSPTRGPFLFNPRRAGITPYTASGFQYMLCQLFDAANIRDLEGRRPRVHDLRHSCAVQALIRSYRDNGDPQALLPKLALYLGHASIESTLHYVRLVPAVAALASARFETHFGRRILGDKL